MRVVASRELRYRSAEILRRVAEGDRVTITMNAMSVAEIAPVTSARRHPMLRRELITMLARNQADPGLRDDLAALAGDTTADLDSPT